MNFTKDFSVIVPTWRGAVHSLPSLINSIPNKDGIEIIVVDNSKEPLLREEIKSNREFVLLHSAPERHAGGSRNDGMTIAKGEWLLFADADDCYTSNAFDVFSKYKDSDADVIYFCADGVYPETGERSGHADLYSQLVQDYIEDSQNEWNLRLFFHVPWAKMVKHSFVEKNHIRFDEVVANNDDYFSLISGYYAKKIAAVDEIVYIYAVSHGSLMHRRSFEVMRTRYEVILRCNKFKKQNGLAKYQGSVMYFLAESRHYGFKAMLEFFAMLIKYRQNPFIGMKNWLRTFKKLKSKKKNDAKYIVKQ